MSFISSLHFSISRFQVYALYELKNFKINPQRICGLENHAYLGIKLCLDIVSTSCSLYFRFVTSAVTRIKMLTHLL